MQTFPLYKRSYLNEEVACTEHSPSVNVPDPNVLLMHKFTPMYDKGVYPFLNVISISSWMAFTMRDKTTDIYCIDACEKASIFQIVWLSISSQAYL